MKATSPREGDLLLIPLGEVGGVVARVLYVSKVFKNVMLVGFVAPTVEAEPLPSEPPAGYLGPLQYTGAQAVVAGRWKCVGHIPLTQSERELSRRIVAGRVWLGDEDLGVATDKERTLLPQMAVAGAALVERRAIGALSGAPAK